MARSEIDLVARFNQQFDAFQKRMQELDARDREIDARLEAIRARGRTPEMVKVEEDVADMSDPDFDETGEPVFEVERINGMRTTRRDGRQFRVVWKGYSSREASWVCEADLEGCQAAVYEYLHQRSGRTRR